MNVVITYPIAGFTGNVTVQDGSVTLPFTNGTATVDIPPSAFGAITAAGMLITIGTPGPAPAYDANLDVATAAINGNAASQTAGVLRAALVPKWKASTAYASGEFVLNPSGQVVSANTAFTSGTTYSASNWTVVSGGGGGAVSSVAGRTGAVTLASTDLTDSTVTGRSLVAAADTPTARTALGLGTAATQPSSAFQSATPTTILSAVTGTQALALPATSDAAYDLTLTGNTTLTLSGGTSGRMGTLTVVLRQDAPAGRTVTFPAAVAWPGQTAPTLNVSAGKYDVLQLTTFDAGTTWIGALVASAVQPVTAPAAPVSVAANPSSAQVILTWADAGNGGAAITGHKVYRGTTSGGETLLATIGNVVTYTDSTGLTNGTTYFYKVTAINALGEGPQSAEVPSTPGHYLNVTTGGASTPYVAGMEPGAGTVDLRALVQMANWIPSGNNFVLSSWGATALNNRYALYVDNAGKLNGAWYNPAGLFQGLPSTVATNIPANGTKWIRALLNPTAGTCTYYTSDDGTTWTQLGTTITGLTTTGVQTGGTAYTLTAGQTASASGQFAGRVYKAQLLVAAAAKAAVDYTTATAGAGTVTGSQGETWTTIAPAAVV